MLSAFSLLPFCAVSFVIIIFGSSTTWDRSTTHPKFAPARVQTHDLQIMTVHFHATETSCMSVLSLLPLYDVSFGIIILVGCELCHCMLPLYAISFAFHLPFLKTGFVFFLYVNSMIFAMCWIWMLFACKLYHVTRRVLYSVSLYQV